MKRRPLHEIMSKIYFFLALALCAALIVAVVILAANHAGNDIRSFNEPVLSLEDGWTFADSAGNPRDVSLPETIKYGADGEYTLSTTLPEVGGSLLSPALRFYSNYVDVTVLLDGEELYSFPEAKAGFSGATGNTYHFVRMPADYAGKTLSVKLRCQLGDDITYLINPPQLGSKATMLSRDIMRSLPFFTLAGCMCVLATALGVLYFAFRKRLELNNATLFTAVFTLVFAIYVYFETTFAQLLMPNGYLLCYTTLTLLALVPLPLIGIFLNSVSSRFRPYMWCIMALCCVNVVIQAVLNFTGVKSVRAMLPSTHAVIVLSIAVASLCLFFSDRVEKPNARRSLLSAVPMIAGGLADITLLNLNRPSLNNCLWFVIGVAIFIVGQLFGFIQSYFALYTVSVESKLYEEMAYRDALSGIGNRNAYERRLKELSASEPSGRLCCVVADINDLKLINDTLGHRAGDAAISETGGLLGECMPEGSSFFRTGGDEFVALIENCDEAGAELVAKTLEREAKRRGELLNVPLSLAVGFGQYDEDDGNIVDFIRRVDTLMYANKRKQKTLKKL